MVNTDIVSLLEDVFVVSVLHACNVHQERYSLHYIFPVEEKLEPDMRSYNN